MSCLECEPTCFGRNGSRRKSPHQGRPFISRVAIIRLVHASRLKLDAPRCFLFPFRFLSQSCTPSHIGNDHLYVFLCLLKGSHLVPRANGMTRRSTARIIPLSTTVSFSIPKIAPVTSYQYLLLLPAIVMLIPGKGRPIRSSPFQDGSLEERCRHSTFVTLPTW